MCQLGSKAARNRRPEAEVRAFVARVLTLFGLLFKFEIIQSIEDILLQGFVQ